MISRLTAYAATFAVLATASIAFAANQHSAAASTVAAKPVRIIQLEHVTITAKRLAPEAR